MNEELKVIISAEIGKLKSEVGKAQKSIKDFVKKGTASFEDFNEEVQKVGEKTKTALKVVGASVVGAAAALLTLSASTQEYRTNQAKLNSAFEAAGGSAKTATKVYNDLYKVLGDDDTTTEAAQQLANISTEEKTLAEYTNIVQGVYAKWGSAIDSAGFTEGISHTIELGEVQGTLADAIEWCGISTDAFNEKLAACATEEEREKLIRETLNGLYSDSAAAYETNASSVMKQNQAQANLNASMAKLGEAIAPINTALTQLGADILAQLAPYIEEFAANHLPAIQEALSGVGEKIGIVINWIADNWELITTLGSIVLGVATAFSIFSTVMGIVNAVMAASPVTWVVLGIVAALAAVAAIIVVVIKYWDEIKAAVGKAVEVIKQKVSEMVEKVVTWFNDLKEKISGAVQAAKEAVVNKFNEIKTGISEKVQAAKEAAVNKFNEIKSGITEKINGAKTAVTSAVANIVSTFKDKFNSAKETVFGIFENIKSGITNKINAAKDAVGNVINAIKGFFNFKFEMPHIPKPSFGITPTGWVVGDLLKGVIPKLSIKWNAQGGVFDKPTLFNYGGSLQGIGEDGAEAVVPLEKNTQWLDKIADRLAAKQSNIPIILQVDGKTFAQTSINSINQLTRQTGTLGLNLI